MSILKQKLRNFIRFSINLFLSPYCIICNNAIKDEQADQTICCTCLKILPWLHHHCEYCANPLTDNNINICGACIKSLPRFNKTTCVFTYEKPISFLIMQFKFFHRLILTKSLGELLAAKLQQSYSTNFPDILIPVPLHQQRLKQRGFNQALEIGKIVSKRLNIPINKNSLKRIRATRAQSEIPAKKRLVNVKNAFICEKGLEDLHVLLIDDVITTGHTINECCLALQKAGVTKIDVCAVARTKN